MSFIDEIEARILEAASFDRLSSKVRAPGYSSYWPTIFPEKTDYGYQLLLKEAIFGTSIKLTKAGHVSPRTEVYEQVMFLWLGKDSPLTLEAKKVVWLRLGGGVEMSWRKIAKTLHCSHEKARQRYVSALITLQKFLTPRKHLTEWWSL